MAPGLSDGAGSTSICIVQYRCEIESRELAGIGTTRSFSMLANSKPRAPAIHAHVYRRTTISWLACCLLRAERGALAIRRSKIETPAAWPKVPKGRRDTAKEVFEINPFVAMAARVQECIGQGIAM